MEMVFRWYGRDYDKIPLNYIEQIPGCNGIVGTLFDIPVGEVWPKDKIKELKKEIEKNNLTLKVIESVNVHEDIKLGLSSRDKYIENYKKTIKNLATFGIEVICYNFMPVFDWVKTNLDYELPDGSTTMSFEENGIARPPEQIINDVKISSGKFTLPGWEPERLVFIEKLIESYANVTEDDLRNNLEYFLNEIIPVCEEYGIKMAIHPDDPPYSIFGLPRIIKNREDLNWLCETIDSPSNGITLCTGSISEDPSNNVYKIIQEFTARERIFFAHVRNIKFINDKDFYESAHFSDEGSLDMYKIMDTFYKNGFDGYIRPDHGRMIWGEKGRPGYGLYDRALGMSYLRGLWEAIEKQNEIR